MSARHGRLVSGAHCSCCSWQDTDSRPTQPPSLLLPGVLAAWCSRCCCKWCRYDAVTTAGKLQWQNGLTPLNGPFFDLAGVGRVCLDACQRHTHTIRITHLPANTLCCASHPHPAFSHHYLTCLTPQLHRRAFCQLHVDARQPGRHGGSSRPPRTRCLYGSGRPRPRQVCVCCF
jgi:hypothetical protein